MPWPIGGRRVVVEDESMEPTLRPGDQLRVDRHAFDRTRPEVGTIVVVQDPDEPERWLVKRVAAVGPGRFWLLRDRLEACTAPELSPVREGATEIVELREGEIYVLSDRPAGARDSRRFGPLSTSSIVGRVIYRTGPEGRVGPM